MKFLAYKNQGYRILLIYDKSRNASDPYKRMGVLVKDGVLSFWDNYDKPCGTTKYTNDPIWRYIDSLPNDAQLALSEFAEGKITESKNYKNIKTKKTITESQLRDIVAESVIRVLETIDISTLPWANAPYEYVTNCRQMESGEVQRLSGWDEWADNPYHIQQKLLDNGTISILSKEKFDSLLNQEDSKTKQFLSRNYTYYAKNNRYDALFAYSEPSDVHFFFGH